ncbi:hypothetical protein [Mycolicibacterium porcinum]|uniref:Uncharacterized protein n=1 Tax=Mycolicibacterium porcinum TaxID=39693 RepID=A0ABV3VDS0_9MYCO
MTEEARESGVIEFQWAVPISQVGVIKQELDDASAKINPYTEDFEPPADEAIDYAASSFEPLTIIAGTIAIGYLIGKVSQIVLDARHGGAIVDARGPTLQIRSNPSVPRGTIVVVSSDKVETFRDSAPAELEHLVKMYLKS